MFNTIQYKNPDMEHCNFGDCNDIDFIELENTSNTLQPVFEPQKDLVYSIFKTEISPIYENIFKNIIEKHNYHIKDISVSYMSRQHYDFNGEKDKKAEVNEIIFKFNIAHNNHIFIENNYFTIGINPATLKVTGIRSKILSLKEGDSIEDNIDEQVHQYRINDKLNEYIATYIKKGENYLPAILKLEEGKNIPIILNIFGEEE